MSSVVMFGIPSAAEAELAAAVVAAACAAGFAALSACGLSQAKSMAAETRHKAKSSGLRVVLVGWFVIRCPSMFVFQENNVLLCGFCVVL